MMKQQQIFYIATPYEIEKAYLEALGLGSARAGYELGRIYQLQEKQENYKGEIKSIKYFEKAFNANFDDWDKENLFRVINYKVEKGLDNEEAIKLYIENASMGYVPAIEKLFELVPFTTQQIWSLYDALIELAETGDETAIVAMNKLEMHYVDLIIRERVRDRRLWRTSFSAYVFQKNVQQRSMMKAVRSSSPILLLNLRWLRCLSMRQQSRII